MANAPTARRLRNIVFAVVASFPLIALAACPASVVVSDISITMPPGYAKQVRGDTEIDTDDYTEVGVSYKIYLHYPGDGSSTAQIELFWYAQELNKDRTHGDTRFESRRIFPLYTSGPGCSITSTSLDDGSRVHIYEGEIHALVPFPDTGMLKNIFVQFDRPGRDDLAIQRLQATVPRFTVHLKAR